MKEEIENILDFMIEIEKLKNIHRSTKPVGLDRYENSAEHSWHVSILALMFKDYSNEKINIDRVIRMLLIHDLGEIYTGDTIIYESETKEKKDEEANAVKKVLSFLSEKKAKKYLKLWYEFEVGETADSKFAKAMDRIPPLFHNLKTNGHSWRDNNIKKEQVFEINCRIGKGSEKVWEVVKSKLDDAVETGLLK